jgi:hypothetical protein
MTEILYTDRIIQLIELHHNDSEILKIIHEEYNIYLSIDVVKKKRISKNLSDFNQSNSQSLQKTTNLILEDKTYLIREMFEDIYYVPLTKKEIIKKIYENHKIIISQIDAKEILWKILKSEIIYDRNDWTYKFKNKNKKLDLDNNSGSSTTINNEVFDYTSIIDGYTISVRIVEREFDPLYWSKIVGLNQIIYFNKLHPKASTLNETNFVQLLIALGRTSLSFSDNSGEIFFNRLKNYIDLTN